MRPLVNLATEPFRNRRLFWIVLILMFLIPAIFGQQAIRRKAERESEIIRLRSVTSELESRIRRTEKPTSTGTAISPEQNKEIYAASELLARKSFSWSLLLNELERNLPPGVRLLRVAVSTVVPQEKNGAIGGSESAALLSLDVIGKSNQDVTNLINKLHDSGRFRVFPLTQKPVEGTEEVEFSLKVDYYPQAEASPDSKQIASQVAGPESGKSAAPKSEKTRLEKSR